MEQNFVACEGQQEMTLNKDSTSYVPNMIKY